MLASVVYFVVVLLIFSYDFVGTFKLDQLGWVLLVLCVHVIHFDASCEFRISARPVMWAHVYSEPLIAATTIMQSVIYAGRHKIVVRSFF